MSVDEMSVDKILVDKMLVDKMLVNKMLVDEGSVDEMLVNKMSVDKISIDEMLVDEMSVDKMSVDEMSVDELTSLGGLSRQQIIDIQENGRTFMVLYDIARLTLLSYLKIALHYLPSLSAEANTHCELALVSRKTVHFLSIHSPSSA
jgi:hypothetical protein